jgi:hypothetical protein
MVDLATALGVGTIATFAPLFVGLVLPKFIAKSHSRDVMIWLIAASSGIIFWFFIDVMNDAAQLGISQGFGNGLGDYTHPLLALMFAVGVGVLFGLERRYSKSAPIELNGLQAESIQKHFSTGMTFAIAAAAALGIGFHALGEGIDIGSSLPKAADIIGAIGGFYPGIAYVLHKLLEGFVVGVFAVAARATSGRKIGLLAALSGIPTVIGFFVGLPSVLDSSYFFALGGAGAVYVEFKLIPILSRSGRLYASILIVLVGFYSMYFAGLFHN